MAGKDIEPGKRFDVSPLRSTWDEFKLRQRRMREDKKWTDDFKEHIRQQAGVGTEFYLDNVLVATYYQTDRFKAKEFEQENPHIFGQYVTRKVVEEFDEERFRIENPEMWDKYRSASFNFK